MAFDRRFPLPLGLLPILAVLLLAAPVRAQAPASQPADYGQAIRNLTPRAIEQVIASSRSDDPARRANAMEAAETLPDRAEPILGLGLEDANPGVRFAALVTMGKLQVRALAPAARRQLQDPSASVRGAALFALHRIGEKVDLTPLSNMLSAKEPGVRANAALLFGMLGDKSAIPMLLERAKVPMPKASSVQESLVRLQITEAVLRLGDESVIGAVRAAAYSESFEVRVLAVQIMGEIGDRKWEPALRDMLKKPTLELQLAAADALARLGHPDGLPVVLQAAQTQVAPLAAQSAIRAQAAVTLAQFRAPEAAAALAKLLDDSTEQVRVAAAVAILRSQAK